MNFNRPIILLAILYCLCNLCACSSEPTTREDCIYKYMSGVKNDKAAKIIEQACDEVFGADNADNEYFKCVVKEMSTAKSDEDINIIIRRCRMKEYNK